MATSTNSTRGSAAWVIGGLTLLAMTAFAANSILGRAALKPAESADLIDPATYTWVRILTGAIVLVLIQMMRSVVWGKTNGEPSRGLSKSNSFLQARPWSIGPAMLTIYAVCFSYAYIGLDTASGTLILFAFVQMTMVAMGIQRGEIPGIVEICGLLLAFTGFLALVAPQVQTPYLFESILMCCAGVAWGVYSFFGKGSSDPIFETSRNFLWSVPAVTVVAVVALIVRGDQWPNVTTSGLVLAALSGGVASGLGYVLWYVVLPSLKSTQAAAIQLVVPILAGVGGWVFNHDRLTTRLIVCGALILGGIALTIRWSKRPVNSNESSSSRDR